MNQQTVVVPDGYNGHTVLMCANPIEEWPDGTVKLRCAVPGKDQLAALLETQRHESQG